MAELRFDADCRLELSKRPELVASVTPKAIPSLRRGQMLVRLDDAALSAGGKREHREYRITVDQGAEITLLAVRPAHTGAERLPGLCFFHGGGMIAGDERSGLQAVLPWVDGLNTALISVGYRLAPEHPHPAPVNDAYSALSWMDANRLSLGLDDQPLILVGQSAGGGIAAAAALMARDRHGPPLAAQILMCPMLDDRALWPSSRAYDGDAVWDARSNATGWEALLGDRKGGRDVDAYAAPARATDLAGLPPTFIDVGGVETFRDEAMDYAARLSAAGVPTEFHLWAGAFHGFDVIAPEAAVSRAAQAARLNYMERALRQRETA